MTAVAVLTSPDRCAVEITVTARYQTGVGLIAGSRVDAVKIDQGCVRSRRSNPIQDAGIRCPARSRSPVELAVRALNQPSYRV
jgi:hypothetical protein